MITPGAFWSIAYLSGYVITLAFLIALVYYFPSAIRKDDPDIHMLIICCATVWPLYWFWVLCEWKKNNPWQ